MYLKDNSDSMIIQLVVRLIKKTFLYKNELFPSYSHKKTKQKRNGICLIMQQNLT